MKNNNKTTLTKFFLSTLILTLSIGSILGAVHRELIYGNNQFWFTIGSFLFTYMVYTVYSILNVQRTNRDFVTLTSVLSFTVVFTQIIIQSIVADPNIIGSIFSIIICILSISYFVKNQMLVRRNSIEIIFINSFFISNIYLLISYFNKKEQLFSFLDYKVEPIILTLVILIIYTYLSTKKVLTNSMIQTKYLSKLFIFTSNVIILLRVALWKI
jgi:hypothetical protein